MSREFVLQTQHLKKYFGAVHAVEDVSLAIRQGEIFGFLGPNGAGKTTTISMILGLTYPNAGLVTIFGQRVTPGHTTVLRNVGMMVGAPAQMQAFTARQNLQCLAHLYPELPAGRIDEVLEQVGLKTVAHRTVRAFSTGMKQRMGLALALLSKPELLILDEPTNGMDPAGMYEIRALLHGLAQGGTTVFLSSHLLHEMEQVCDRVAVVQHGQVIAEGTVADLLSGDSVVRIHTAETAGTAEVLRALPAIRNIEVNASYVDAQGVSSEVVMHHLVNHGFIPTEVTVIHPDLESVFLELTGQSV
jgi:ABC-type multidrug transport system ATPase subunit